MSLLTEKMAKAMELLNGGEIDLSEYSALVKGALDEAQTVKTSQDGQDWHPAETT